MATTYHSSLAGRERDVRGEARKISEYLDSKYTLPFGLKKGWDGILGLIPGVGDLLTNAFSFYIIYKASMIGCPPAVVLRMGINVLIDNVIDAVSLIGNIFDFIWKANTKNVALLEQYLEQPRKVTRSSRLVVAMRLILVAAVFIACIVLTFYIATWILGYFKAW